MALADLWDSTEHETQSVLDANLRTLLDKTTSASAVTAP